MRLLHWVTSGRTSEHNLPQFPVEWGAPPPEVAEAGNGMFCILYSDVGAHFSTVWTIPQEAEAQQGSTESEWTWLKYGDLDAFGERDVQLIRRTMENLPESTLDYHCERPKAFATYLPFEGVGSYPLFRSMFAADSIVSMDVWGVEKKTNDVDQPTCATWSVELKSLPLTLTVTRISTTESEFPGLLRHIQAAARKSGISKMEIWNICSRLPQKLGTKPLKEQSPCLLSSGMVPARQRT